MKRIFVLTLSLFLIFFGLCACKPKDDNTIELNEVTHSILYSPLYLAISLGYFEDEGLTVNLTNGGGADKSMTAVLSGEADIDFMRQKAAIYVVTQKRSK